MNFDVEYFLANMVSCSSQPYDSYIWITLAGVWNDFQCRVFWQIGDRNKTNLWLDKWILNGGELLNLASKTSLIQLLL